jgi:hypothetical protein
VEGLVGAEGETTECKDHGSREAEPLSGIRDDRPEHDEGGDDRQISPRHMAPADSLQLRRRSRESVRQPRASG